MTTLPDLLRTRTELERGRELGWYTGAQLFVSLRGEVLADIAIGESRPGVPMTPSTLVEWGSATKPVTCGAALLLWQRGLFDLDDPVCRFIPEFARAGKDGVTIRHLLTHTGGLRDVVDDLAPFDEAVAAICEAPLLDDWVPGVRHGYNSAAMWIVAALVSRLSGSPFDQFVRVEIFEPLGLMDSWIGMPPETFHSYGNRIAVIPGFPPSGTERWVTWGRPTGGGHGPIGELARFYQSLLEHRLLSAPVVEAMTARQLCGSYDETLRAVVDRGFGVMQASSYAGHSYGPHASNRCFGHGGKNWCVAFGDPVYGLAAGVYWNGRVDGDTHAERQTSLLGAIYEDLSLV